MGSVVNHAAQALATNDMVDRRSDERVAVRDGIIASLGLTVLGPIVNISRGGLAFRYVASQRRSKESSTLTISVSDNTFTLGMMPYRLVWDVASPQSFSYGDIALRYCGVEFGELKDFQKLALRYFIKHYGVGTSEH
jgi:hypothetical protein